MQYFADHWSSRTGGKETQAVFLPHPDNPTMPTSHLILITFLPVPVASAMLHIAGLLTVTCPVCGNIHIDFENMNVQFDAAIKLANAHAPDKCERCQRYMYRLTRGSRTVKTTLNLVMKLKKGSCYCNRCGLVIDLTGYECPHCHYSAMAPRGCSDIVICSHCNRTARVADLTCPQCLNDTMTYPTGQKKSPTRRQIGPLQIYVRLALIDPAVWKLLQSRLDVKNLPLDMSHFLHYVSPLAERTNAVYTDDKGECKVDIQAINRTYGQVLGSLNAITTGKSRPAWIDPIIHRLMYVYAYLVLNTYFQTEAVDSQLDRNWLYALRMVLDAPTLDPTSLSYASRISTLIDASLEVIGLRDYVDCLRVQTHYALPWPVFEAGFRVIQSHGKSIFNQVPSKELRQIQAKVAVVSVSFFEWIATYEKALMHSQKRGEVLWRELKVDNWVRDTVIHYENGTRTVPRCLSPADAAYNIMLLQAPHNVASEKKITPIIKLASGKKKRVRLLIMGARLTESERAVIVPCADEMPIDAVGIGLNDALKLTTAEYVCQRNIDQIQMFARAGYVVAYFRNAEKHAVSPTGSTYVPMIGDHVIRRICTGDRVIDGRQPTLLPSGMSAVDGFVMNIRGVIGEHLGGCSACNADFDGDEKNIQNTDASVQKVLQDHLRLSCKMAATRTSSLVVSFIQSTVTALYRMTGIDASTPVPPALVDRIRRILSLQLWYFYYRTVKNKDPDIPLWEHLVRRIQDTLKANIDPPSLSQKGGGAPVPAPPGALLEHVHVYGEMEIENGAFVELVPEHPLNEMYRRVMDAKAPDMQSPYDWTATIGKHSLTWIDLINMCIPPEGPVTKWTNMDERGYSVFALAGPLTKADINGYMRELYAYVGGEFTLLVMTLLYAVAALYQRYRPESVSLEDFTCKDYNAAARCAVECASAYSIHEARSASILTEMIRLVASILTRIRQIGVVATLHASPVRPEPLPPITTHAMFSILSTHLAVGQYSAVKTSHVVARGGIADKLIAHELLLQARTLYDISNILWSTNGKTQRLQTVQRNILLQAHRRGLGKLMTPSVIHAEARRQVLGLPRNEGLPRLWREYASPDDRRKLLGLLREDKEAQTRAIKHADEVYHKYPSLHLAVGDGDVADTIFSGSRGSHADYKTITHSIGIVMNTRDAWGRQYHNKHLGTCIRGSLVVTSGVVKGNLRDGMTIDELLMSSEAGSQNLARKSNSAHGPGTTNRSSRFATGSEELHAGSYPGCVRKIGKLFPNSNQGTSQQIVCFNYCEGCMAPFEVRPVEHSHLRHVLRCDCDKLDTHVRELRKQLISRLRNEPEHIVRWPFDPLILLGMVKRDNTPVNEYKGWDGVKCGRTRSAYKYFVRMIKEMGIGGSLIDILRVVGHEAWVKYWLETPEYEDTYRKFLWRMLDQCKRAVFDHGTYVGLYASMFASERETQMVLDQFKSTSLQSSNTKTLAQLVNISKSASPMQGVIYITDNEHTKSLIHMFRQNCNVLVHHFVDGIHVLSTERVAGLVRDDIITRKEAKWIAERMDGWVDVEYYVLVLISKDRIRNLTYCEGWEAPEVLYDIVMNNLAYYLGYPRVMKWAHGGACASRVLLVPFPWDPPRSNTRYRSIGRTPLKGAKVYQPETLASALELHGRPYQDIYYATARGLRFMSEVVSQDPSLCAFRVRPLCKLAYYLYKIKELLRTDIATHAIREGFMQFSTAIMEEALFGFTIATQHLEDTFVNVARTTGQHIEDLMIIYRTMVYRGSLMSFSHFGEISQENWVRRMMHQYVGNEAGTAAIRNECDGVVTGHVGVEHHTDFVTYNATRLPGDPSYSRLFPSGKTYATTGMIPFPFSLLAAAGYDKGIPRFTFNKAKRKAIAKRIAAAFPGKRKEYEDAGIRNSDEALMHFMNQTVVMARGMTAKQAQCFAALEEAIINLENTSDS